MIREGHNKTTKKWPVYWTSRSRLCWWAWWTLQKLFPPCTPEILSSICLFTLLRESWFNYHPKYTLQRHQNHSQWTLFCRCSYPIPSSKWFKNLDSIWLNALCNVDSIWLNFVSKYILQATRCLKCFKIMPSKHFEIVSS